jgi:hypothetical protein
MTLSTSGDTDYGQQDTSSADFNQAIAVQALR